MAINWKYVAQEVSTGEWNLHDNSVDTTFAVALETTTVSNTTVETAIYTAHVPPNTLRVGNVTVGHVSGAVTNASASDNVTIRLYFGGDLVATFGPAIGNVTDADWHFDGNVTQRTVGAVGNYAFHGTVEIDGSDVTLNTLDSIDTGTENDFVVTVQFDNAKPGNSISMYQGFIKFGYSHEETESSSSSSSFDSSSSSSSSGV